LDIEFFKKIYIIQAGATWHVFEPIQNTGKYLAVGYTFLRNFASIFAYLHNNIVHYSNDCAKNQHKLETSLGTWWQNEAAYFSPLEYIANPIIESEKNFDWAICGLHPSY